MKRIYNETSKKKLNSLIHVLQSNVHYGNNIVLNYQIPKPNKSLDPVSCSSSNISKVISHVEPNKPHGHDMLSIRMMILRKLTIDNI